MPTDSTKKQVRTAVQNRKGLSKVEQANVQRSINKSDVNKNVPTLLVELVRDKRVSIIQFRRMAMCAGAAVSDFFDTTTGRPYTTKVDIMMQIAAGNRAVTYVPKFVATVTDWLADTSVRTADIVAALTSAGLVAASAKWNKTVSSSYQKIAYPFAETEKNDTDAIEDVRQLSHSKSNANSVSKSDHNTILPTSDGLIHTGVGTMPKVAAVLAASYIVLRGVNSHLFSKRHNKLVSLMTNDMDQDRAFQQAQELSPAVKQRTYAQTNNCLQRSYDTRLHEVFIQNTSITNIRKALIGLRKPWFFGGRTLLNLHLIRSNGQVRDSPAEIAYALLKEYKSTEVFDAAVSYSAAAFTSIFSGLRKALRNDGTYAGTTVKRTGGCKKNRIMRRTLRKRKMPTLLK